MQTSITIRKRIATLFFLFGVMLLALGGRVFWVQLVQGAELSQKAEQNRMRDVPVESKRGIIYDRNRNELAISISTDSVYAIPAEVKSKDKTEQVAQTLADILDMDLDILRTKVSKNSSFEWIKRQISSEQAQAIRDAKLDGIDMTEESRRFYPKGTLASHILGISGLDNTGLEGIDHYYNELVGGIKGRIVIEHDAVGREIPEATHSYVPPVDGANLILTIDETIQYIAEREIEQCYNTFNAKQATIIVMDPNNGEILALASRPNFDPNDYNTYPDSNRRNFSINDAYEPGSTMKISTLAMALEEKVVSLDSTFDCPGYIKIGKSTIHCSQNRAHGHQNLTQIFDNSCNVGFVQVGMLLGLDRYFTNLDKFGFGKKTGIDLPGEFAGILVSKENAKQIDLGTMAMGQANAVTPIQLATAVSGIVNGGTAVHPHLVKQITGSDGKPIEEYSDPDPIRLISPETSALMRQIMESEVINGTGKNAAIEGYRVGGKTGTAQKISPTGGYMSNEYIVSFLGVAPIQDPKILCLVVVDAPQGYPYYGGWVCAPVAREVMRDTLRYLGEPLDSNVKVETAAATTVVVPDVVNLPLAEAKTILHSRGLSVKVDGDATGDMVYRQVPRANSKVAKNSQILLSLNQQSAEKASGNITVPDLYGKSMKETASILSSLGLYLTPEGSGLAYEQLPEAGEIIGSGSVIQVKFRPIE